MILNNINTGPAQQEALHAIYADDAADGRVGYKFATAQDQHRTEQCFLNARRNTAVTILERTKRLLRVDASNGPNHCFGRRTGHHVTSRHWFAWSTATPRTVQVRNEFGCGSPAVWLSMKVLNRLFFLLVASNVPYSSLYP